MSRRAHGKVMQDFSHLFDSEKRMTESAIHQVLNNNHSQGKQFDATARLKFGKFIDPM